MNEIILSSKELTMDSLEIAKLTGKRHDHVLRDIDNMFEGLEIDIPKFGETYLDGNNREQRKYNLTKDLTLTLISGYNVKLRKAIIDKWLELENKNKATLPGTYREALYALIEKDKQLEEAQKTKAYINDKKVATAMNTASQKSREANKLRIELDKSKEYCTIKRMQMLYHGQSFNWRLLKSTSSEMEMPPIDVFDANYGTVKAYNKEVWKEEYGLEF